MIHIAPSILAADFSRLGEQVLETERGFPTRVSFRVPANSCLLAWRGGRLVSEALPPPGASVATQHEPGPFGL